MYTYVRTANKVFEWNPAWCESIHTSGPVWLWLRVCHAVRSDNQTQCFTYQKRTPECLRSAKAGSSKMLFVPLHLFTMDTLYNTYCWVLCGKVWLWRRGSIKWYDDLSISKSVRLNNSYLQCSVVKCGAHFIPPSALTSWSPCIVLTLDTSCRRRWDKICLCYKRHGD